MLAADAKKAGHTSHLQASVLHWEAGLKPLYVGKVGICDALNGRS